jgi:hypothetical protein
MGYSIDGAGGESDSSALRDQRLAGGRRNRQPVVFGGDLVDTDEL